ncbi:uncharacterized protein ACO6RY_15624 [Pungitius sinensis]
MLKAKDLAYAQLVCKHKTKLSDLTRENVALKSEVAGLLAINNSLQEELLEQETKNNLLEEEYTQIETEALAETTRENEGLSLMLTKITEQLSVKSAELMVNNETWQQKYDDLEEKTSNELKNKQESLESKVAGLLSTNDSLQAELLEQRAKNQQFKAQPKLQKIETEALAETIRENEDLSLKLTKITEQLSVKSAELTVNNKTWQQKYDDLEEKTSNELNYQQQSLKSKVAVLLSTNDSLQAELHDQKDKNRQLEAECKLLEIITEAQAALQKSHEETLHKLVSTRDFNESRLIAKIHEMEDNIAKGYDILTTRIQDLEDDKTVLENICLDLKKKKRGIFGRRMQDRQTEMDKMRRKMQESKK